MRGSVLSELPAVPRPPTVAASVQDFEKAMEHVQKLVLSDLERQLLTEPLAQIKEWSVRDLDNSLLKVVDKAESVISQAERCGKKLKALHNVHTRG